MLGKLLEEIINSVSVVLGFGEAGAGLTLTMLYVALAIGLIFVFFGHKAYRLFGGALAFALVVIGISFLMRNVQNKGYTVTIFSLLGIITAFVVYNRERLCAFIFLGCMIYSLCWIFGLVWWVSLACAVVLALAAVFTLPHTIMVLFTSALGAIAAVRSGFAAFNIGLETYITIICICALFVIGIVVQYYLNRKMLKQEWIDKRIIKEKTQVDEG